MIKSAVTLAPYLVIGAAFAAPVRVSCIYEHASSVQMNKQLKAWGMEARLPKDEIEVDEQGMSLNFLYAHPDKTVRTPMRTVTWTPEQIHAEIMHGQVGDSIVEIKRYRHITLERTSGRMRQWYDYKTATGTSLSAKQVKAFVKKSGHDLVDTFEGLRAEGSCKAVKQQF